MSTDPIDVPGHVLVHSGKVRDIYAPIAPETGMPREDQLLLVASDRISAYDHVLDTPIPDKGEVLTRMSLWWFDQLADLVPNHVLSTQVPDPVAGRAIYVRRLRMLPVECVARAYLTGGGLAEYREYGTVSGLALPPGLEDGSRMPEPVFTPSTKAPAGEHDRPMSYAEVEQLLGATLAARLQDLTVQILARGNEIAAERGILLADTKVEFGLDPSVLDPDGDGTEMELRDVDVEDLQVVLADEVLTPDSSRFWKAQDWQPGRAPSPYDKQYVRDWLTSPASGWDRDSGQLPPPLPQEVVAGTRAKYIEVFEVLTGQVFRG